MKTIRIGLLGCGNVGAELCRLVAERDDLFQQRDGVHLEIAKIGVADPSKPRAAWIPGELIVDGWRPATEPSEIDIVVELIGGVTSARDAVFHALTNGLHTVTANKALLDSDGAALTELAAAKGVGLCFEAAVGAGVPVVGAVAQTLSANRFQRVLGILNGTTNFILTRMTEDRLTYDQALDLARERGFCEADPSFDVEGTDAAQKLAILAALAFGTNIPASAIYTEGVDRVTAVDIQLVSRFDYVIKLLAIANRTASGVELRVHPALVSNRHPLAAVRDEFNAIFLTGDVTGEVMLYGRGAGPGPTAGAVLSDVLRLATGDGRSWLERKWAYSELAPVAIGETQTGYHMIFPVRDEPGVIGRIASTLGSFGINIESAHAHLTGDGAHGLVQILSMSARERDVGSAFEAVRELPVLTGEPRFFRIEIPHPPTT